MKQHRRVIELIIGMVLITMLPFFFHTPLLGHDQQFHLSNIEVLSNYLSWDIWKQGFHIIPEIANNLGYGIGIFYPILPHLLGAVIYKILSIFGFASISSIYTLYFLVISLSSIIVYFISLEIQEKKKIALLSAIFYMTMPYLLSDLWIRFSLNEIFLLLFFPMIILSLFKLLKGEKKLFYFLFIIGYVGMITSHLVMTLYFTLLLIPFFLLYYKKLRNKISLMPLFIAIGIVSILVLPNIFLFLEHWFMGGYIVFQENMMTSLSLVESEVLHVGDYLFQIVNYDWTCAFHIPIMLILLFFISFVTIIRDKKKLTGYFLVLFGITLFMMSPLFLWSQVPDIFLMIQFPWRLEIALMLAICIIAPLCLSKSSWLDKKWFYFIFVLIYLICQVSYVTKLLNRAYELKDYAYSVNDAMGHQQEYLPIEASDTWEEKQNEVEILEGSANTGVVKNKEKLVFYVKDIDKEVTIELPKLYYLGYQLKDEYGNQYDYQKSRDGYIEAVIDQNGTYTLVYTGTISYRVFRFLRFLFLIFLTGYGIYRMNKSKL